MDFANPYGAHRNAGIPVEGRTWSGMHVVDDDLATVIFQDCTFEDVRFERTDLRQTMFLNSRLDNCTFSACELVETRWISCQGTGIELASPGQDGLVQSVFSEVRFDRVAVLCPGEQMVFSESEIGELCFVGDGRTQRTVTLSGCTFGALAAENAVWSDGTAVALDLGVCAFDGAAFERCSFIASEGHGKDLSTAAFESCNLYQSDFSEGRFREAPRSIFAECNLAGTDFEEALLDGALFASARAEKARFDRARLPGALFPKASLVGASFEGAHAPRSVWTDADLSDGRLDRMNAEGAVFRNAVLAGAAVQAASFVDTDLHGVAEALAEADRRGARGTIQWRADLEAESGR